MQLRSGLLGLVPDDLDRACLLERFGFLSRHGERLAGDITGSSAARAALSGVSRTTRLMAAEAIYRVFMGVPFRSAGFVSILS